MTESHRDDGLLRNVGTWGLAASVVNTVVGGGIFVVPAALAASVGTYAPLAFLVCAVAVGSVAICFAEGGSRVATSGGAYGTIEAAFGPLASYIAGTLLWFANALSCGGLAAALADVIASLVAPGLKSGTHAAVILSSVAGVAVVNLGGVARGIRLVRATTALKLLPLFVFVVAGASAVHGASLAVTAAPGTGGLGQALLLAVFALQGMEGPLSASGEVAQPSRTIPRALAIAMLSVTLLYVAIQVIAQGILGSSLAASPAPLADAMGHISPALRVLMLAGAAMSMFGWIGSDILGTPRVLFALARDGLMPRVLGRVHPRSHAPHVAIVVHAAIVLTLALTGTFSELAVLSTLFSMPLYIAGCAAAWRLARRGVATAGPPLGLRWLPAAAAIGIGSMLFMTALASAREMLALVAAIAVSAITYGARRRYIGSALA